MFRHELDPAPLVGGILFVVVGILFVLHQADAVELQARWVWPVLLIGLGLAGLLGSRPTRSPD